jgi:hypothetical protein
MFDKSHLPEPEVLLLNAVTERVRELRAHKDSRLKFRHPTWVAEQLDKECQTTTELNIAVCEVLGY